MRGNPVEYFVIELTFNIHMYHGYKSTDDIQGITKNSDIFRLFLLRTEIRF